MTTKNSTSVSTISLESIPRLRQGFVQKSQDRSGKIVHDSHSMMYHLLKYPILFTAFSSILLNFFLYVALRFVVSIYETIRHYFIPKRSSATYKQFVEHAKLLDLNLGLNHNKLKPHSFDATLIKSVITKLRANDIESITNNLGGIENEKLYSHCHYGTKDIIDLYCDEAVSAIERADLNFPRLKKLSLAYGRTALCLSGGATLSWLHLGVLKTLLEQKLLPTIITGTSAGSVIAAMKVCVRSDKELLEILDESLAKHITVLSSTIKERIAEFWRTGAIFDDEHFREKAKWFCKGDTTFLEAYESTGKVCCITVMSTEKHSQAKVLNHITSPHVTLRSAVTASSSIPGILPPCILYMKTKTGSIVPYLDAGNFWRDGSMRQDIPSQELYTLFRVKNLIVCQVNPHIGWFFYRPKGSAGQPSAHRKGNGWRGGFLGSFLIQYLLLDIHKWLNILRDMDLMPYIMNTDFSSLFLQSFEGQVTIIPPVSFSMFTKLLVDPDKARLKELIRRGEVSTWPKLKMIANRMRIEQAIGKVLKESKTENNSSISPQ